MTVAYIAGPYRARNAWAIEQNIRRAEEASLRVWGMGCVAICPHTLTRHFQGALPDAIWLTGDLELIRRSDVVLVIEGWEDSEGTKVEIEFAHEYDIPVVNGVRGFAEWLADKIKGRPKQLSLPFRD